MAVLASWLILIVCMSFIIAVLLILFCFVIPKMQVKKEHPYTYMEVTFRQFVSWYRIDPKRYYCKQDCVVHSNTVLVFKHFIDWIRYLKFRSDDNAARIAKARYKNNLDFLAQVQDDIDNTMDDARKSVDSARLYAREMRKKWAVDYE